MENIMTDNVITGGKVWEPEMGEISSKPRAKTYWLVFLTMCLIGSVASATNIIGYVTNKVNTTNNSIQITGNVFSYIVNNTTFSEVGILIGVFIFCSTALIFTLLCFGLGKPPLTEAIMVPIMLAAIFALVSILPATNGLGFGNEFDEKKNSWINEEMGATYQTAVDPELEESSDGYVSSYIYISEDNNYYHLKENVTGNKHTLSFEQINKPLEFERIDNVLTVKK
jgi:hypothetical protein